MIGSALLGALESRFRFAYDEIPLPLVRQPYREQHGRSTQAKSGSRGYVFIPAVIAVVVSFLKMQVRARTSSAVCAQGVGLTSGALNPQRPQRSRAFSRSSGVICSHRSAFAP